LKKVRKTTVFIIKITGPTQKKKKNFSYTIERTEGVGGNNARANMEKNLRKRGRKKTSATPMTGGGFQSVG